MFTLDLNFCMHIDLCLFSHSIVKECIIIFYLLILQLGKKPTRNTGRQEVPTYEDDEYHATGGSTVDFNN